jgi:importin subunit beta-1
MCDDMDTDSVAKTVVDQILNTIVSGMRSDQPNEMRRAAVNALLNSLEFTHQNFAIDMERDAIMQAVCEATQCSDVQVRVKAFECISTIASLYYDKLKNYAAALFQLTSTAIKSDDRLVGQYAIEFWSTVAEEEFNIMEDIADDPATANELLGFTIAGAPTLLPILLETLTKQEDEEAEGDEDWNISLAAAHCLERMALVLKDQIVDPIIGFVRQYVASPEWRLREAAIMAFSSVLEGPSSAKIGPIVSSGLPALISSMGDKIPLVRDTTGYAISRIFEYHPKAVTAEALPPLVTALLTMLGDRNPRIASVAALSLHNLAWACQDQADDATNVISPFFTAVLQQLFVAAARPDGEEGNLRNTSHEAIDVMINNGALDTHAITEHAMTEVINRLALTFQVSADLQDRMTVQSMLCGTLGCCIRKLPLSVIQPKADRCMELFLQVLSHKGAIAHEDALISIGFLADKLGAEFIRYMQHLSPVLLAALSNVQEHAVVTMACGVVGDVSRALGKDITPICDQTLSILVQLLQSDALNRCVVKF